MMIMKGKSDAKIWIIAILLTVLVLFIAFVIAGFLGFMDDTDTEAESQFIPLRDPRTDSSTIASFVEWCNDECFFMMEHYPELGIEHPIIAGVKLEGDVYTHFDIYCRCNDDKEYFHLGTYG